MAAIVCEACGGDLVIEAGSTVAECEYCGKKQTIPTQDNEKKLTLFKRANRLRMNGEFDKAFSVYESIVAEFSEEAKAYWGLVLCKYGIEYVDDPATGKKIPTCHRSSFDSVMEDADFEQALENADVLARRVYRDEAKQIEELRKSIIEVSGKEEPYDIFICYKETAENGDRTIDSVIAQDVYDALTVKGYRVFFSRITLEDKLGQEYEPYIFAALNSAKIMLAFGTDYEYYNAVWVKNEWSRYLKLMAKDKSKHLIPCYKNIDAYDMPKEFAKLQAQDMGKIGAMQDLLRGIEKILPPKTTPAAQRVQERVIVQNAGGPQSDALLQRGYMALDDNEWNKADSFFEQVLNQNAQCAEAYLGKLLARDKSSTWEAWVQTTENKYRTAEAQTLEACPVDRTHIEKAVQENVLPNYLSADEIRKEYAFVRDYHSELACRKKQKDRQLAELKNDRLLSRAQQYASGDTKKQLDAGLLRISKTLDNRIAEAQNKDDKAIAKVKTAYANRLKQGDSRVASLRQHAENRQEATYQKNVAAMKSAQSVEKYQYVKKWLLEMNGYKDSYELAMQCQKEIDRIEEAERQEAARREAARIEAERRETERKAKEDAERKAREEAEQRAKEEAARLAAEKRKRIIAIIAVATVSCIAMFLLVTKVIIPNNHYNQAVALMNDGKYEEAIDVFQSLNGYKDSATQIQETYYLQAGSFIEKGDYKGAYAVYNTILGFKDVDTILETNTNLRAVHKKETFKVGKYVFFGSYEQDNDISNGQEAVEWIVLDKKDNKVFLLSRFGLDVKRYNAQYIATSWEQCGLRIWLNRDFFNKAFTDSEQEAIELIDVDNSISQGFKDWNVDGGNNTQDKIFLLSYAEARRYLGVNKAKNVRSRIEPTAFAKKSAYLSDTDKTTDDMEAGQWWLRSPGSVSNFASLVDTCGTIHEDSVDWYGVLVRPAMWVDLDLLP